MTVNVASLERRTPEALRAFVRAQHVGVERRPDSVTPDALAAVGMIQCLVGVMETLDGAGAVPASRIARAVRLASRVAELMPPIGRP